MATSQVVYGNYGVVTILEHEGTLTKIDTDCGEFWVKTDKLYQKARPVLRQPKPQTNQAAPIASDEFVLWLLSAGCHIAFTCPEENFDLFAAAYEQATGMQAAYDMPGLSVMPTGKQWSFSSRVVFNKPPADLSPPADMHQKSGCELYEICHNRFTFELLALGFVMGTNTPTSAA